MLSFTISATVFAQDGGGDFKVKVKGFADTYHAVRCEKPNDWMSSRSRLRGEVSLEKNHSELFFSANAVYNSLISDYSGFKSQGTLCVADIGKF